jgi:hypothetical protein
MLRALSLIPASTTSGSSRLPPAASSEYAVSSCSARASSSAFLVVPVPVQRHRRGVRASGDCMHGGRPPAPAHRPAGARQPAPPAAEHVTRLTGLAGQEITDVEAASQRAWTAG